MKFLCNFHLKFKEVYIMAQSICPKCGNSQFEGVEKRIVGLRYSVMFIQCMSCGCVVGVLNFSPQGFVIRAEGLCGFQIRSYITRGLQIPVNQTNRACMIGFTHALSIYKNSMSNDNFVISTTTFHHFHHRDNIHNYNLVLP